MRYYQGPYLQLYRRPPRQPVWIVRDFQRQISTGCREDQVEAAETFLKKYATCYNKTLTPEKWSRRPWDKGATVGTIYFVSSEALSNFPIKIGIAYQPLDGRIKSLQNGSPYRLVILAKMPGTATGEADLHRRFRDHRLESEWFARTPELLNAIERINTPSPCREG